MRIFGILLCLVALGLTGYSALIYKAPRIEAEIQSQTVQALTAVEGGDVDVKVDGRHVVLSGSVAEDERRQLLLTTAAAVPGALGPIDRFEHIAVVSPYHFAIAKDEDGRVTVEGLAPSRKASELIAREAKALFGDTLDVDIEIARGAPSKHWELAAISSMDALGILRQGKVSITDQAVSLEGDVTSEAEAEAIDLFADTLPEGFSWAHDVSVHRERVEPFTFSVVKDRETGLRLSGFAPDEDTRQSMIEQGKAISDGKPVIADIRIADGMPDDKWPPLVVAGIGAMKDVEAGRFEVVDNDMSFASDPAPADDTAANAAEATSEGTPEEQAPASQTAALDVTAPDDATGDDVTSDNAALNDAEDGPVDAALAPATDQTEPPASPLPALTLEIDKLESDVWSVKGTLPDRQAQDRLVSLIQERAGEKTVETELAIAGDGSDGSWADFAADRLPALDEVRAGRLSLDDDGTHLIGVVETPEDIETVEAAIAAIDPDLTVDLQPIDPRPLASLDLTLSPEAGIALNGIVPEPLTEGDTLAALGIRSHDGFLDEGGRGPADAWRRDLAEIAVFLPMFEQVDLSLGGERPMIEGQIHTHGDIDAITDQLVLALGADAEPLVNVRTATSTYQEGATRTGPLSGRDEVYRQGFWIPMVDIDADAESCTERAAALQADDKITFGRGQETLDHRALAVLNELAGLAAACLEQADLSLEIGGHTDARGGAEMNRKLSQTRADAVREALVARGIDADALTAVGYSDTQPVADNDTAEGRAANRRITFEWTRSANERS